MLNKSVNIQGSTLKTVVNSKYTANNGNFLVENTTEKIKIFQIFEVPLIGQTWNVTISLTSNSTTGIMGSASSEWANIWEGPSQFELQSGEDLSVQYILHACGDFYDYFILKFYAQLQNSSTSVQGSYSTVMHFFGYGLPSECYTGHTYVSDITKWLNREQNSTQVENLPLFIAIICSTLIYKRKRISKKD